MVGGAGRASVEMDIARRASPGGRGLVRRVSRGGSTGRRTRAEHGFRCSSAGTDDDLGVPPGDATLGGAQHGERERRGRRVRLTEHGERKRASRSPTPTTRHRRCSCRRHRAPGSGPCCRGRGVPSCPSRPGRRSAATSLPPTPPPATGTRRARRAGARRARRRGARMRRAAARTTWPATGGTVAAPSHSGPTGTKGPGSTPTCGTRKGPVGGPHAIDEPGPARGCGPTAGGWATTAEPDDRAVDDGIGRDRSLDRRCLRRGGSGRRGACRSLGDGAVDGRYRDGTGAAGAGGPGVRGGGRLGGRWRGRGRL